MDNEPEPLNNDNNKKTVIQSKNLVFNRKVIKILIGVIYLGYYY